MNRVQQIAQTPLIRVERFDHPSDRLHRDPPEEIASSVSLSFLEQGEFEVSVGRRAWTLGPGMLFRTWPGMTYRCRHSEARPADICLTFSYRREFAEEISDGVRRPQDAAPVVARPTNRLGYLRERASRYTARRDALALETLAGELFGEAAQNGDGHRFRVAQLRWYAERVDAARECLETEYAEPHSLASLARGVAMSPFHFARVFRELAGVPPHRYLLNVRLARAAERLREGASVTETCYACGFGNLSHFIRLFRRRFGAQPSQFRTTSKEN